MTVKNIQYMDDKIHYKSCVVTVKTVWLYLLRKQGSQESVKV